MPIVNCGELLPFIPYVFHIKIIQETSFFSISASSLKLSFAIPNIRFYFPLRKVHYTLSAAL